LARTVGGTLTGPHDKRHFQRRETQKEQLMDYQQKIERAIKACPHESAVLATALAKRDGLGEELHKIHEAMQQLQAEPKGARTEKRMVHGIELVVPANDKDEELGLLAQRANQIPDLLRRAGEDIERARRQLSRVVSAKLAAEQSNLEQRTIALIQTATELGRDGEALEVAAMAAGLDPHHFFAARFKPVQDLRADVGDGAAILARLADAPAEVAA